MTVSVVIPAYNAARFMERTLDTVQAQTFQPHETVVVDDGSTDGTSGVVEAYLVRRLMNGRLVRQQHLGIAAARNTGMRVATGFHVALLDSDDLWYPDKLAVVMDEFERHPDVDLIGHDENISRGGTIVRASTRRLPSGDVYDALLFGGNMLSPSATVMRRDLALALGGFDERPGHLTVEDYDFWLRFSRLHRMRLISRVLGEYVLRDDSASRRIVFHHDALERMLREHLSAYVRSHTGLTTRIRVRRRLARVYRSAARQLIEHGESPKDQEVFVGRMLRAYPFDPRNLVIAMLWMTAMVRGTSSGTRRSG